MSMNKLYRLNSGCLSLYLKREFKKRGYLSYKLEISEETVKKMLYQSHIPKQRTLEKLAKLIGCSVEELIIPLNESG